jgi:LmbE family N-acetylglucosaminyl deacetylase
MANRRLLLSLAHPDDESFGSGALIARYVAEGADVYYVCATNGDVGTVSPELLNGYNSVAELRLAELDKASEILGFKKVFKLGYKDSGMMGDTLKDDPASLWQANHDEVTRRVVEVIRDVKPQVVITFNKYGGYGHPDHIKIQQATVDAFHKAGDSSYITDGYQPYAPQKLYYTNIPAAFVRFFVWMTRMQGKDPRKMGRNADMDMQAILDNIEPSHTRINIRPYFDIWDKANSCHVSQGGGKMLPVQRLTRIIAGSQSLTRIYPKPAANRIDEYDLFAGVRLDEPVQMP